MNSVGPLLNRKKFMENEISKDQEKINATEDSKAAGILSAGEKIEEKIPESQGDLADRAGDEIESDIRWRVERIRLASREDESKRFSMNH